MSSGFPGSTLHHLFVSFRLHLVYCSCLSFHFLFLSSLTLYLSFVSSPFFFPSNIFIHVCLAYGKSRAEKMFDCLKPAPAMLLPSHLFCIPFSLLFFFHRPAFSFIFECFVYILQPSAGRVMSSKDSKNEQLSIKQSVLPCIPCLKRSIFGRPLRNNWVEHSWLLRQLDNNNKMLLVRDTAVTHQVSLVVPVEWDSFVLLAYNLWVCRCICHLYVRSMFVHHASDILYKVQSLHQIVSSCLLPCPKQ